MPRTRRRSLSLLAVAAAAAGTLAVPPLRPRAPGVPAPHEVPEPPSWPLLGAGLVALAGAVAVRRRA